MERASWPLKTSEQHPWAFMDDVFTADECDQIIDMMTGESKAIMFTGRNDGYRNSEVSWLWPNPETVFVFQRLTNVVNDLNKFFGFDLNGFDEGLQLTRYGEGGKYEWHVDSEYGRRVRKLSLTVQLSDPLTYSGGDLELRHVKEPVQMDRSRGRALAFPSWTFHRVTPVTEGTRYSLVAWITGPPFR